VKVYSAREEADFRRLGRVKSSTAPTTASLGPEVVSFFKSTVTRRQTRLGKIAEVWAALVPPLLCEHCALESLHRGGLTVIVDSSSHLYDLKQLLLAGLEKQLLLACKGSGLRKITLKAGRWYEQKDEGDRRARFG
jgi:hypothetical protein